MILLSLPRVQCECWRSIGVVARFTGYYPRTPMTDEVLTLEFDGGSRGNPGPAAAGVVVRAGDGTPIVTVGKFIGRATNNVAEYEGLILAMQKAKELGARRVLIHGDSELIVKQMNGQYRVKSPDLKPLYEEARTLFRSFEQASITHNYRRHNELADRLANLAMDRKADVEEPTSATAGSAGVPLEIDLPSKRSPEPGARFACARCGCVVRLEKPSTIRPHQLKDFTCQCGQKMSEA